MPSASKQNPHDNLASRPASAAPWIDLGPAMRAASRHAPRMSSKAAIFRQVSIPKIATIEEDGSGGDHIGEDRDKDEIMHDEPAAPVRPRVPSKKRKRRTFDDEDYDDDIESEEGVDDDSEFEEATDDERDQLVDEASQAEEKGKPGMVKDADKENHGVGPVQKNHDAELIQEKKAEEVQMSTDDDDDVPLSIKMRRKLRAKKRIRLDPATWPEQSPTVHAKTQAATSPPDAPVCGGTEAKGEGKVLDGEYSAPFVPAPADAQVIAPAPPPEGGAAGKANLPFVKIYGDAAIRDYLNRHHMVTDKLPVYRHHTTPPKPSQARSPTRAVQK